MRINAKNMRQLSMRRAAPTTTEMYLRLAAKGRNQIRCAAEKGLTSVQFLATLDYLKVKTDSEERSSQVTQLNAISEHIKTVFEADGFTVTIIGKCLMTISWGNA